MKKIKVDWKKAGGSATAAQPFHCGYCRSAIVREVNRQIREQQEKKK